MCLNVKEGCNIGITINPIPVFKMIITDSFLDLTWRSPLFDTTTKRKYNKVLTACDHLELESDPYRHEGFHINKGFHALTCLDAGVLAIDPNCYRFAVIPSGSEYCIGNNNDIVSTKLIVFRSRRKFLKYLKNTKYE